VSALTSPECYATLFAVQRHWNVTHMKKRNKRNNVTKGTIRKKQRKRRIKKMEITMERKRKQEI
jgi:hypothetical protein